MVRNELGENNDSPFKNSSFEISQIGKIPIPQRKKVKTLLVVSLSILIVVLLGMTSYLSFQNYQTSRQIGPLFPPITPAPIRVTISPFLPSLSPVRVISPTVPPTMSPMISSKPIGPFEIKIVGDDDCIAKTKQALDLIEEKASDHYEVIVKYLGVIECVESGSGMLPWLDPPLYKAGRKTIDEGPIWYAGTIIHDSCHSRQYNDYLFENPSIPVPSEVYRGRTAESQCLDVQFDALTKMGASQRYLDHVKNSFETDYWNVNYEERWW